MIRCNVPSIFIYGGSCIARAVRGPKPSPCWILTRPSAAHDRRNRRRQRSQASSGNCLPTIGACAGQFTANTMAMVSEAMGLTIPNVSMIPGVYAERAEVARRAGRVCDGDAGNGAGHCRANRDPKIAGKRRSHRRRHRRIDQRRVASAGARQRGRHIFHDRRCRQSLCADAPDRQFASGGENIPQRTSTISAVPPVVIRALVGKRTH